MTFIILVILHLQRAKSTLLFEMKGYKVEYYTLIDRTMKIGIRIPTTIVILLIFVVILTARGTLDSVDSLTNSTTNQTTIATATPATTISSLFIVNDSPLGGV